MSDEKAQNTTILVVDDVTDNLILISLALQNQGYKVLTAKSGEEAIKIALIARPELVLMDIAMPDVDGLAATRRIRKHPELRHLPVIALTAFETQGFRQAAFEAGFDGYLTKPIDFEKLNNLINVFLRDLDTTDLSQETKELAQDDFVTGKVA
ncbi:MAG TPA: response regulator [Pyrinomonadaceae bacterium]|jgi:two-component system cell cycle response regulator DivK